jgi:hypothetical protein
MKEWAIGIFWGWRSALGKGNRKCKVSEAGVC